MEMKLGDIINKECRETWKDLCDLVLEMLDSAEKTRDSGLYMSALRLTKIIPKIANSKVDISKIVEVKNVK
ncbi:MAG: hypothetical protein ACTSXD_13520 [Candidatus Heimdallarchaeaceae archaeon]